MPHGPGPPRGSQARSDATVGRRSPSAASGRGRSLLWPLEFMPAGDDDQRAAPWQALLEGPAAGIWRPVDDEFPTEPELFQERHYSEFVTFLPYVQRFCHGISVTPLRFSPGIQPEATGKVNSVDRRGYLDAF